MIKAFVRCFNFCSSPVFENDDDVTNEPAGADVSKQLRLTPLLVKRVDQEKNEVMY